MMTARPQGSLGRAGADPFLEPDGQRPLRLARDADAQDLFGLLALCFEEYPGCFVDPHDDLSDLLRAGSSFADRGGAFFVVED